MAWKVSLNLCDHLSGVATKTRAIVDAAHSANPACEVLTTRKSMPGVKDLLTKAVTCGGAFPHRLGASETVLVFDHLYNRLCQISLGEHRDVNGARTRECGAALSFIGEDAVTATPGREGYMDAVNKIKQMLRQGEAIQVVPSCRFSTPFAGDAFTLYRRMRRCNASPYMFFMDLPGITLFGSSPEVMVRCDEGKLQLSPIAGTRKRGADDLEDARLAAELQEDPKERAEHVMLVDLGRNDLGRIARPGTVNVERLMEVERFSHVMHLTSRITARLQPDLDALDVLAATFPAGTVSGAPKVRAMEIIAETEQLPHLMQKPWSVRRSP